MARFGYWVSGLVKLGLFLLLALWAATAARAGGPKYVAGVSYFNPAVKGQALHWAGGQLKYFVDQGVLNSTLNHAQATAMVDAAAGVWNNVPTAAVSLTDGGALAEDVNGSDALASNGVLLAPSDVTSSATGTPVAVIFDADGSVTDALEGSGASEPDNCEDNSLLVWIDNMTVTATIAHAVIVLNGRCGTTANLQAMMSFQLERAFGRILGLDYSQVNDGAQYLTATEPNGVLGWPIMIALNGECDRGGGACIPNPTQLRLDDVAALNRIYPVTSANVANFPGTSITAANTVSIQGTISFRNGMGMQGVNVVARPLDGNGKPMYQYTVTFVSGAYFGGNHGNPVTGFVDASGNRLDRFGSDSAALQGFFDLSGMPLPPGMTSANYQITLETVNPIYIDATAVGPYLIASPTPSGTMPTLTVNGMHAGSATTLTVNIADSASGPASKTAALGTETKPVPLARAGMWTSRLGYVGASDWLLLPVRANRTFTVVAQALNEGGVPSGSKALPALGVWDGVDLVGSAAAESEQAANGFAPGETWMQVSVSSPDIVRLAIADQRGDGRPDYVYQGWVLYADTVSPIRLPAAGGTIVIRGMGFRAGATVKVGGVAALVTSILPNAITAVAASASVSGSVDVEVDDLSQFNASAIIPGGVSYDAGTGDGLTLITVPSNLVPLNVPQAFSVVARGSDGSPAGGVTVIYSVTSGTATLGCGQSTCSVTATGDGLATIAVTATSTSVAVVTASLMNGANVQAHFYGGAPAVLTALTPTLYLAAGAKASWTVQAMVESSGAPVAGQQVTWQSAAGIVAPSGAMTSNSAGVATAVLTVGPLTEGQTATSNGCVNNGSTCVAFSAFGARPELAGLVAVSGTAQAMTVGATPAPVVLRVLDTAGHAMVGATVTVSQSLYTWVPPCPRHGRCPAGQLLAKQATTAVSAMDGSVSITPLSSAGVATSLVGLAATGNTASLGFTVVEHP